MIPAEMVLICDPRVLQVPIQECGELLVDMVIAAPDLRVDSSRARVQTLSASISLVRQGVAQRLQLAQKRLPDLLKLLVKEGHRPRWVQQILFDAHVKRVAAAMPSSDSVVDEAAKYVAPPDGAPPHSTGGAVDLTLFDEGTNRELDMGTPVNVSPSQSAGACYTLSPAIPPEARRNRSILADALSSVGFVNYPTEWWHWSYGDRYWAYHRGYSAAIYDAVETA